MAGIGSSLSIGMGQMAAAPNQKLADAGTRLSAKSGDKSEVRETFDTFVGEVFFGQMMESMRKTVGEPAYFHGGRAEEMFTERLDQVLSEEITKSSASQFSEPMFDLFMLSRQ
jgi:peptidoglycan hydrolase FlgJ